MPKRAALLFDQLMVALQKVVNNQGKGSVGGKGINKSVVHRFPAANSEIVPVADDQMVANSVLTFKQFYFKIFYYHEPHCKVIEHLCTCSYSYFNIVLISANSTIYIDNK